MFKIASATTSGANKETRAGTTCVSPRLPRGGHRVEAHAKALSAPSLRGEAGRAGGKGGSALGGGHREGRRAGAGKTLRPGFS